jgi:peptide/nickel transport system substrate-binding protein
MFRPRRLAAVALASALAIGMSACTSSGDSGGNAGKPGSSVSAGDIDTNAILMFTAGGPTRNLDPIKQTSYGGWGYLVLLYDRLTQLDKDDNIVPDLATSWKYADDGSYLELKLRDDVKFQDGTPFNAEAVKVNLERAMNDSESAVKADLRDVKSVTAVDATTVRLGLQPGTGASLPSTLATATGMMVSPKAIKDRAASLITEPAGSGPFTLVSYTPNEKVVVKKWADYWDKDVYQVGGMELERIADGATRLKGVQTGITDLTAVSAPNDLAQAKQLVSQGAVKEADYRFRNILGIYLRADQGDLKKLEVRKAIAHAVDPAAVSALFSNTCAPNRQLSPEGAWYALNDWKYPYEYNLDEAKKLVQQAGGAKVKVTFAAQTNAEQLANVVQAEMKKAGINAELNPVPNSENEPRFIKGDFELMAAASFSPKIDPAATVDTYFLTTYNLAPDKSVIADTAAKAADPRLSQDERAKLYGEIWQTALKDVWFIPICQQTVALVHNDKVVGADNVPWANIGLWDLRYVKVKK